MIVHGEKMAIYLFFFACLELAGLIKLGQTIGAGSLLGLILLTGIIGMLCLRLGGRGAIIRVMTGLAQERVTLRRLALRRSLFPMFAGILLIIPGVLSDLVGIILIALYLTGRTRPQPPSREKGEVIDIDYQVHEDSD